MIQISLLTLLAIAGCMDAPTLIEGEIGTQGSAVVNGSIDKGHPAVGVLHTGGISACTATLIGSHTVLTAAHCVTNDAFQIQSPINFYIGGLYGTKYPASAVAVHQSYSGGNKNDIAVVILSKNVTGVTPKPISNTAPKVGANVILVGYGLTGENQGKFGTKRMATNIIAKMTGTLLTMKGAGGAIGNICNGDSGGPTFAMHNGQEILIGVHSTKGGVCGQEGNDMRVDAYYSWIAQIAKGDLYQTGPQDSGAPQVKIAQPLSNATLSSSFAVQVNANDDVGVTQVAIYVNGVKASSLSSGPFSFQIQNLKSGSHTIEAVAYDSAGHTSSDKVTVHVGSTAPPASPGTGKPWLATCSVGADCSSGICTGGASGRFCSKICSTAVDCPGTYDCDQGICQARTQAGKSSPGVYGSSCASHQECGSGLCARDNSTQKQFCTALCDLNQNNCPQGSACQPAGNSAICGPLHDPGLGNASDGPMLQGGCNVSGETTSTLPFYLMGLFLVLVLLRRRRTV